MSNEDEKQPFDETVVLEELERLRGAIRQARTKREEKVAEFELFMRNARMAALRESARAVGVQVDDEPDAPAAPERSAQPPIREAPTAPETDMWPVAPPVSPPPLRPERISRLDDMEEAKAAFPEPAPRRRSLDSMIVGAGAGVLIIALLIVSGIGDNSESTASRSGRTSGTVTPPSASAPQTPGAGQPGGVAGTPASATVANRALQVELVTLRPVWMRVTVDGDRVVEREVAKDQRLQFGADRAIVIRAGDAGAVTVSVDGQAATPLGPDGQIATRTVVPRAK